MAGPYCSVLEVRKKLKDITRREIPEELINSAISDSDSTIDAYLTRYYDVTTFSSADPLINSISKSLAASITVGSLYADYDQVASQFETRLWKEGEGRLKLLQDGTVRIPGKTRIAC